MISLNKLNLEDIDEKIRLNQDAGIDIFKLQESIKSELKEFQWMKIRAEVQCQAYTEQLEHIENRIKEGRVHREPGPNEGPSVEKNPEAIAPAAPVNHPETEIPPGEKKDISIEGEKGSLDKEIKI